MLILNRSMGMHHGYDIQDDNIWKSNINNIKSCIHVWKSRNLTCRGKTLIIKNVLLSLCGYEIVMKGIPDKYVKEINDIMWSFIWNGKINQINRNVCCLETNEEGIGMLNIDTLITSKQIKLLYRILHSPLESWNAIGNFWLHKLDFKYNEQFTVCRCSNVSTLKLNNIPKFYRNLIHSWSKFNNNLLQSRTIDELLERRLFCNSNITSKNKSICFASFLKSNIRTIKDIWTTIENDSKSCKKICSKEFVQI